MTGPREPEPEPSEIEWLDGGPAEPGHQPRIPRAAWYVLIAVVIASVVIALTVSRSHPKHRASAHPTRTPTAPSPRLTPSRSSTPSTTTAPVTVRNAGHRLLDVPRGVELFASSGDGLLRLELATGRITRTDGVGLTSGAPSFLVAGQHEVIVKSFDNVPGFVVPDGQPPRKLTGALAQGGAIFPGPDPAHVWVSDLSGSDQARSELVGLDGRRTGITLPIGADLPDGTGYLLADLTGGVYDVRPGSVQRVTSGAVLAVGHTRWLTKECDAQYRCTVDVVDRATGGHHILRRASDTDTDGTSGTISPDGRIAAIPSGDAERTTVHLIDLNTGADRPTSVQLGNGYGIMGLVWTPDSRWLLTADRFGRVVAIDRNGRARVLTNGEVSVTQLALRAQ